jgi:hypothetical protein
MPSARIRLRGILQTVGNLQKGKQGRNPKAF